MLAILIRWEREVRLFCSKALVACWSMDVISSGVWHVLSTTTHPSTGDIVLITEDDMLSIDFQKFPGPVIARSATAKI